jgi:hypothetical protein
VAVAVVHYLELKVRAALAAVETGLTLLWPGVQGPQIRAAAVVAVVILGRMSTDTLADLALSFCLFQRLITREPQPARQQ